LFASNLSREHALFPRLNSHGPQGDSQWSGITQPQGVDTTHCRPQEAYELRERAEAAEAEVNDLQEVLVERDRLELALQESSQVADAASAEADALRARLAAAAETEAQLRRQAEAGAGVSELSERLGDAQAQLQASAAERTGLAAELASERERLAAAEARLAAAEAAYASQQERVTQLQDQLAASTAAAANEAQQAAQDMEARRIMCRSSR